jgi:hypothetical protein
LRIVARTTDDGLPQLVACGIIEYVNDLSAAKVKGFWEIQVVVGDGKALVNPLPLRLSETRKYSVQV